MSGRFSKSFSRNRLETKISAKMDKARLTIAFLKLPRTEHRGCQAKLVHVLSLIHTLTVFTIINKLM